MSLRPRFLLYLLVACLFGQNLAHAQGLIDPALKQWLRARVTRPDDLKDYGLLADADWEKKDKTRELVVLVHGLNSDGENSGELISQVRAADYPCAVFQYPNDQPINDSAKLLSEELKHFAKQQPDRGVVLVTHSMGGLVSRRVIEDDQLDPGNVRKLIMVAPPNQGSLFAHFGVGTDLIEHLLISKEGKALARLRRSVVDGLGEAIDDLRTDSEFIKELNARNRNPNVRYTIILGTKGAINDAEREAIREILRQYLRKTSFFKKQVKYVDSILLDLDEVLEGKGDSVVAVKRGRLDGVDDVVLMDFHHMAVVGAAGDDKEIAKVLRLVLERVQQKVE
jgi:pimeloyl-ACP methyl ester carboxylesterase